MNSERLQPRRSQHLVMNSDSSCVTLNPSGCSNFPATYDSPFPLRKTPRSPVGALLMSAEWSTVYAGGVGPHARCSSTNAATSSDAREVVDALQPRHTVSRVKPVRMWAGKLTWNIQLLPTISRNHPGGMRPPKIIQFSGSPRAFKISPPGICGHMASQGTRLPS